MPISQCGMHRLHQAFDRLGLIQEMRPIPEILPRDLPRQAECFEDGRRHVLGFLRITVRVRSMLVARSNDIPATYPASCKKHGLNRAPMVTASAGCPFELANFWGASEFASHHDQRFFKQATCF